MLAVVTVAVGGAFGSVARYLTYLWAKNQTSHPFPTGTLLINVSGCLATGALMVLIEKSVPFHRHLLLMGVTGFIGSYTTFSAFGFETLHLIRTDHFGWAAINVLANVILGIGALWVARSLTEHWM